ncbi:MAG: right-handed parallel beta-helix repeat-containing protein [Candidatus Electrothrix sp. AR5]|nr:right-handed parallel beta-helix repeat-containing protein [Candidatus Electrothrix sp. AR5]
MIKIRYIFQAAVFFLVLSISSVAWATVWGDINGDGKIGLEEAVYALQVASGTKTQQINSTHSGTIAFDEIWTPEGNPHIVSGKLIIAGAAPNGAILTIQPGVEVRFAEGASIEVGGTNSPGTLVAVGTASSQILFTSNQTTKTKGWWKYIRFNEQAVNCRMSYCTVEYGGIYSAYGWGGNLVVDTAKDTSVSLNHCTIRNSASHGVCFLGSSNGLVNFSENIITGNEYYGIRIYADQVRGIENSNTMAGNLLGGVYVQTSTVRDNALWYKIDTPYILEEITVASQSAEPAVLTVEAGTELRFVEEGSMVIGNSDRPGRLVAQGQADKPIVFTSNQTDKTKGWWSRLRFNGTDTGSTLAYCTVEYGGRRGPYGRAGNVVIDGANNVSINNCTISDSGTNGVHFYTDQSFANLSGNTMTNNGEDESKIYGGYGIKIYADQVRGIQGNNSLSGNLLGGVYVRKDTIENDATWHPLDAPYTLETVTVHGVSQPTLSLESGTELRFVQDTKLVVNTGRLVAQGTIFTSNQTYPTKGWWLGIQFNEEAVACSLKNCTIEYGGGDSAYMKNNNIDVLTANGLDIHNCTISNSKGYGIKLRSGGKADLAGTSFAANENADIYVERNSCANYTGTPLGTPVIVTYGTCN